MAAQLAPTDDDPYTDDRVLPPHEFEHVRTLVLKYFFQRDPFHDLQPEPVAFTDLDSPEHARRVLQAVIDRAVPAVSQYSIFSWYQAVMKNRNMPDPPGDSSYVSKWLSGERPLRQFGMRFYEILRADMDLLRLKHPQTSCPGDADYDPDLPQVVPSVAFIYNSAPTDYGPDGSDGDGAGPDAPDAPDGTDAPDAPDASDDTDHSDADDAKDTDSDSSDRPSSSQEAHGYGERAPEPSEDEAEVQSIMQYLAQFGDSEDAPAPAAPDADAAMEPTAIASTSGSARAPMRARQKTHTALVRSLVQRAHDAHDAIGRDVNGPGSLYVFSDNHHTAGARKRYKVGSTNNIQRRLRTFRTGNPDIQVVGSSPCESLRLTRELELHAELHQGGPRNLGIEPVPDTNEWYFCDDVEAKLLPRVKDKASEKRQTPPTQPSPPVQPLPPAEAVHPPANFRKLYATNLPFDMDDSSLRTLFSECGEVRDAKVITWPWRRSKGYGFVLFATDAQGRAAIERLNGSTQGGRDIKVMVSTSKGPHQKKGASKAKRSG